MRGLDVDYFEGGKSTKVYPAKIVRAHDKKEGETQPAVDLTVFCGGDFHSSCFGLKDVPFEKPKIGSKKNAYWKFADRAPDVVVPINNADMPSTAQRIKDLDKQISDLMGVTLPQSLVPANKKSAKVETKVDPAATMKEEKGSEEETTLF